MKSQAPADTKIIRLRCSKREADNVPHKQG